MDEFSGITVLITGIERLAAILDAFSPTLDCISPLGLEDVADHYATMIEVMEAPENLKDIGDFAVLILETGQDIALPLSAFEPVKITIDELEESRNYELKPTEHLNPATILAHSLAAELIQAAYRHYRSRQKGKQLRRKLSSDHIVQQLAAQTIVQNLKRVLSKSKNKISQSLLHLSVDEQLLNTASVASSSTPLSSNYPSPDGSQKQQISSPVKHNIPTILHNPRSSNILEICDVIVHSVPSMVWNDKNSLYVIFRINGFNYRSTTAYATGEKAIWEGVLCSASMQYMLLKHGKDSKIVIELYNEHLAIKDKLIGQCEFSCASILDQTIACPIVEMTGEIMESTAMSTNRKFRGTVICTFRLNVGEPSESNWWPAGKEDKNNDSVPATTRSRIIDVNADNIPEINGMSPRTIRAAADVLHAWESTPNTTHQSIPAKIKSQESSIPRPHNGNTKAFFQKKPSKVSTRLMDGISHARDPIDQLDLQPAEEATSISGPNTARFSNITDDNNHNFVPMTATTSISGDNKSNNLEYHHSKPQSFASRRKRLFHDILKSRHVLKSNAPSSSSTVPVITDVQFFFDKCFIMAFQTTCSNLEMSALEIVILLDSLGHAVAEHWLEEATVMSSSASASQTMVPFPSLIVPILHHAAFADCICQYVQNYPDILDQSHYFQFTADHASLAITHLIRLLKGSYEDIRSEVCRSSHGSIDMTKKSKSSKVPFSTSGTIRPSRYDQVSCHQLLHLLQMPISVQDSVSHGHILLTMDTGKANNSPTYTNYNAQPSFSSYGHQRISSMDSIASGTLLPQTVGTSISVGSMIKSSLKRARLTLYQTTLRLLDSMWDKGARPWDIYPPSTDNVKSAKSSSPSHISAQHVTSSNNATKRRKSLFNTSQKSNFTNSGSSFVIMEAGKLFDVFVPINRAYGYGYSMQELSHLANTIGGFLCMKDLLFENNDSAKSSESSSLLWVKVLFPSKEIKQHALMILRQHLLSNNHINANQEGNEAINGFIYLRQRNHSKPSLSSQVSLGLNVGKDSHVLSLTDEAVGGTNHDDNVDILVHIPRTCLGSTSIGVSKLLQMSRSKLDSEDIHLGMRLRVVDLLTLQRLCERYEWYDRPSPETLQKVATHRVEVISVAELHSKGRIGVKLLRDDRFCDALPLEAFQILPRNTLSQAQEPVETMETTVEDGNQGEVATDKKISSTRRKSKLKRRGSRDHREVASDAVSMAAPSTQNVPTPVTTASLIADLAAMQQQQEQQREEIQKLKQKQEKLSKSTEMLHKSSNIFSTAKRTMPSDQGKVSSEGKEFDDHCEDADHDEAIRSTLQVTVRVNHSKEETKKPLIGVPNTAKSHAIKKRPLSASITRSRASSTMREKPQSEEKDFSWLKPVEKLVKEERLSQPQPTWAWPVVPPDGDVSVPLTVMKENIPVDHLHSEGEEKINHNGQHPSSNFQRTNKSNYANPPTLHHWQPSFTKETAEYTHGVYVYQNPPAHNPDDPPPVDHNASNNNCNHQNHFTTFEIPLSSSPSRPPGDKSGITDINPHTLAYPTTATSTFFPLRRPDSAPAVDRVAKKLIERQRQELEEQHKYTKFDESPPTSPPKYGGLVLSGFGYTNDGRKESAAFGFTMDDNLYETSEIIAKQEKVKKSRKEKPINSRDASKTALKQLFGMNERRLEEEEDLVGHIYHLDEKTTPTVKPSNKRPSSAAATNIHPKTKTVTHATDKSQPCSPEGKYLDIELARTAKEAAYKENYLLKQLKQLGV